jgi:hypothetical protein
MYCSYVCIELVFENIKFKLFHSLYQLYTMYLLEVWLNFVTTIWYFLRLKSICHLVTMMGINLNSKVVVFKCCRFFCF